MTATEIIINYLLHPQPLYSTHFPLTQAISPHVSKNTAAIIAGHWLDSKPLAAQLTCFQSWYADWKQYRKKRQEHLESLIKNRQLDSALSQLQEDLKLDTGFVKLLSVKIQKSLSSPDPDPRLSNLLEKRKPLPSIVKPTDCTVVQQNSHQIYTASIKFTDQVHEMCYTIFKEQIQYVDTH